MHRDCVGKWTKPIGPKLAEAHSPRLDTDSSSDSCSTLTLQSLLKKHEEIFRDELGTITSCKAKLQVQNDAQPKFCKG